jgi:NAD(P)-dependent dehydrogenase (short-subunit alcohol dehydrogenase family)
MATALSDANALVAGAAPGAGHAVVLQLASGGANVIVHGRNATRGGTIVREITGEARSALWICAPAPRSAP